MSDSGGSSDEFPSTHWSLVWRAGGQKGEESRLAMDRLLKRYLPAMRVHLLARGIDSEAADDLLHEFVVAKILEKDLLAKAHPQCGRFRNFLLTALDHCVVNQLRDARAKKRRPQGGVIPLDLRNEPITPGCQPESAFDIAWARQVVAEALQRMEAICEATGRKGLWDVFYLRVLAPTLEGQPRADYRRLVEQCGFESPHQASNALVTAKRMYARILREVVAEYCGSATEVDEEIADLRRILSGSRA